MKNYRKLVAAVVGIAVSIGLLDPGLAQDVVGVVTAILVYLVPNE